VENLTDVLSSQYEGEFWVLLSVTDLLHVFIVYSSHECSDQKIGCCIFCIFPTFLEAFV